MNRRQALSFCALAAIVTAGTFNMTRRAEAAPEANTSALCEDMMSVPSLHDMPATFYVYVSKKTTLATIRDDVASLQAEIGKLVGEKLRPTGPMLLVFDHTTAEPSQEFELKVGFPVAQTAKAPVGANLAELSAFHCMASTYFGKSGDFGPVWMSIFYAAARHSLHPVSEQRQFVCYWENAESPNNVSLLMVGLQE